MVVAIREVDGSNQRHAAMLRFLQLEALPADTFMETREDHWWVAYEGASAVAFAGLSRSSWDPTGGYLCRAGVLPSHRGHGLQRRLIAARERKARDLGMVSLYTDTYCNPASSNNLIRSGYRMFSPDAPWSFDAACYWSKNLNPNDQPKR